MSFVLEDAEHNLRGGLDDVCKVVSRNFRADIVCIITWKNRKEGFVIGSVGCNLKKFSGDLSIPNFFPNELETKICTPLAKEDWFLKHPLSKIAPLANSLLLQALGQHEKYGNILLLVFNPCSDASQNTANLASLSELSRIANALMHSKQAERTEFNDMHEGFAETSSGNLITNGETDPFYAFLNRTLLRKLKLTSRKSISFVSLRTWKVSAKETQIASLRSLKLQPSGYSVDQIAHEIVEAVFSLHGQNAFEAVLPIPPGSSGNPACLSVLLAKKVAELLHIPFVELLENKVPRGNSHPKNSSKLPAYTVKDTKYSKLLLLDDVTTSGTHLEYALKALRKIDKSVAAIAWIG